MSNKEQLIQMARDVMNHSYSPYSKFPVGAAILMNDGKIFTGVNVENVSFGATNCAERTAIFTAISQGYQKGDIKEIACVGDTENYLPPCSICRQVMVELCDHKTPIHISRNDGKIKTITLGELVPLSFERLDM